MKKKILVCLILCVLMLMFTACAEQAENGAFTEENGSTVEQPMQNELSDDLDSLMFELNGVLYTLSDSLALSALLDNGWEVDDTWQGRISWQEYERLEDIVLEPLSPAPAPLYLLYENQRIRVEVSNPREYEISLLESVILHIFSSLNYSQMVLPGGISVGSTYEEVIAAHGEPTERRTIGENKALGYLVNDFYITFAVEGKTDVIFLLIMERNP